MIRKDSLQLLEFDKILNCIADFAHSTPSCQFIAEIHPLGKRETIENRYGQVDEIRRLAQLGVRLRLSPFEDIAPLLDELRPEGAVLAPRDLVSFIPFLRTVSEIAAQLHYRQDIPLLKDQAGTITGFPHILERLELTLDFEGNILDTASSLLRDLRSRKRNLTGRIRKRYRRRSSARTSRSRTSSSLFRSDRGFAPSTASPPISWSWRCSCTWCACS